jgi:hypothetical protein
MNRSGPGASAPIAYALHFPKDTVVSKEDVPPKREGVLVAPTPDAPPPKLAANHSSFVSGRKGRRNLRAEGGDAKTAAAVDRALHWLEGRQSANGSWGDDRGDTAAAVLAFLADPSSREGERYADVVDRGLTWLAKVADDRDDVAFAFVEAWALTRDPRWREAAGKALARTRSATVRRLARCCGLDSPRIDTATPGTSPLACFGRILAGEVPWLSESLAEAMNDFLRPVRDDPAALAGTDPRFLHDATLAAYQAGGGAWGHWRTAMKRELLGRQHAKGDDTGSWDPPEGMSRARTTALNAATLSVFYRYARLFRRTR